MKKLILFIVFLSFVQQTIAQTIPPEVRKFKFYKNEKLIKSTNKKYKISIQNHYEHRQQNTPVKDHTYHKTVEIGDLTKVNIKTKRQEMNIHAYFSLEKIPFQKGNFIIPYAYKTLFLDVQTHGDIQITNKNWANFKWDKLPKRQLHETINEYTKRDTLMTIPCVFWNKTRLRRLKNHHQPHYADGYYYNASDDTHFIWDDDFGYYSTDNCLNWIRIDYPEAMIDSIYSKGINGYGRNQRKQSYTSQDMDVAFKPVAKRFDEKELIRIYKPSNRKETLLTLSNAWYAKLSIFNDIWCVSGQGYILISKDAGNTWRYYIAQNYNVDIFKIINGQYLFDGLRLYWIP